VDFLRHKNKIAILFLLIGLTSCELNSPSDPEWSNPFDVENPSNDGDPYQLQAELEPEGVRLTWQAVDWSMVLGYNIHRWVDDESSRIAQLSSSVTSYLDSDVAGNRRFEYLVVMRLPGGVEGDRSNIKTAIINPTPILTIESDTTLYASSRTVDLSILALGAEKMLLSNSPSDTTAEWEDFYNTKEWQLETGYGIKTVYLQTVFDNGDTSDVVFDQIEPAPITTPNLLIAGGATTTSTRQVILTIDPIAFEMQLSNDPFTGLELWIPCTQTHQWMLDIGQGTKTVYLNVRDDFLQESSTEDQIDPAPLNPSIIIADGSEQSATRSVPLRILANNAVQMQLSNSPFSGNEEWMAYTDFIQWNLDSGLGTKTVHVNVRNDFLIEADASDQIEPAQINPNLNILPDSLFINHLDIILNMPNTFASQMKFAESLDTTLTNWLPYQAQFDWNLTSGEGWKEIYAWFRNDFYETEPISDTVGYDTQTSISSFSWSSFGEDTLVAGDELNLTIRIAEDFFGAETGGHASVLVDGWQPITLSDIGNGSYTSTYQIQAENPGVISATVTALFIDRAHNQAVSVQSDNRLTMRATGAEREFPLGNTGRSITMVWIPAGSFQMGSSAIEQDRSSDEGPVHTVRFGQGFWMSKYEVTQGQWSSVMGTNPSSRYGVGDDHPVYSISWDNIQEFETRLDDVFHLPSEAEWEYACRSGTQTRFYWGEDLSETQIGSYAWYGDNSESTQSVGHKTANGWNLHDMSGNVWEWCEDIYHQDYVGAPEDGSAWTEGNGNRRVLRGGCWTNANWSCRSANRLRLLSDQQYYTAGFRLVYTE
jgi:formylglycine-generating enzyme required for sulfatase activity